MQTTKPVFDNETRRLVRDTWEQVAPMGEAAAELFYHKLFQRHPGVKPLFHGVDMPAQQNRLIHAIDAVVNALDHFDEMEPLLEDLGHRHRGYGVLDSHYDAVGDALLATLAEGLGAAWSEAVESAWTTVYVRVATVMRGAEMRAMG